MSRGRSSVLLQLTPPLSRPFFFFFNDTATTEIYTLSLHDALPILQIEAQVGAHRGDPIGHLRDAAADRGAATGPLDLRDRKSTRLNSSHSQISYAVFCLKKKNNEKRKHIVTTHDTTD